MKNDAVQDRIWSELYREIATLLRRYGREDATGDGDYWIVDDNYGWHRHTVNVFDLKLLDSSIIVQLQGLLNNLSDWEIVLALDVSGKESIWPHMGVTVRNQEIVDGLVRSVLPEPYRSLIIPGSRPGTGND